MLIKKKVLIIVLASLIPFFSIGLKDVSADDEPAYVPSPPENLIATQGNFWVNYTWSAGANTDSFNVSVNGLWTNGTLLYSNNSVGPHGWSNISVWGYNNSGNGSLSSSPVSNSMQVKNNAPVQSTIGNQTAIPGNELKFKVSSTDADSDPITYSTNATKGYLDPATGDYTWKPDNNDNGTYVWSFSSKDGYDGAASETIIVIVNEIASETVNGTADGTTNETADKEAGKKATVTEDVIPVYIPPAPASFVDSQGNFWIKYTWKAGTGNETDSYNISVNGNWINGTTETSNTSNVGPHGWSNISVWAYNNSGNGQLSLTPVKRDRQVSDNPITLTNVSSSYSLNVGDTLYIDADYIDDDGPEGNFSTNAKGDFNPSTGVLIWKTGAADRGSYKWYINVGDGYGSSSQEFTVNVNTYTPGKPAILSNTTDKINFWVNYTWSAGANTDSFNVSVNGKWYNTSNNYINVKSSPHGWVNLSVAGYNATSQTLSDFVYRETQIPNNPITLTNVSSGYTLFQGETLYINADYIDDDGPEGTFSTNAKAAIDSSSGIISWKTGPKDGGVYNWYISVSDGYTTSTKEFTVAVSAYTPGIPTSLASKKGNFWVNYTWLAGANTSSFHVNIDGTWHNDTRTNFINTTTSPHGWVNISVAGYNETSQLVSDSIYMNTQLDNNAITLTNVSDSYFIYEGTALYINADYTDIDLDKGTFETTATKGTFDNTTGALSWKPGAGDGGIYNWRISVKDGYGSVSSKDFKVIVPLKVDIKFIEPYINHDTANGTWNETWREARSGHIGKFMGIDGVFVNNGEDTLVLTITDSPDISSTYCDKPCTVTLSKGQSLSFMQLPFKGRPYFDINSSKVNWKDKTHGFFNYTLSYTVNSNGGSYVNTSTISLPLIPIYKMKQANGEIALVTEGSATTITYTLEANSSVNLTDVSIYDPFYPSNQGYFNISTLEANKSQKITYTYPATTGDISKFKCEGGYPCIMNMATLTGKMGNEVIKDTDFVRLINIPVKPNNGGGGSTSGGGGGGGGGLPPSEDFKNIERREIKETSVLAFSSSTFVFKSADPVMAVAFESSVSENWVPVAVEVLRNRSKNIGVDAPGTLYKYFNVFVGTSGFSKKVRNGVVVYRVNNTWLEDNGLNPEDISLYKWQEDGWVEKSTEIAERASNHTYYSSFVGNFSSFAIMGSKKQEVSSTSELAPVISNESSKNSTLATSGSDIKPPVSFNLILGVLPLIGMVGLFYYIKIRSKNKQIRNQIK
ncbi:MAG: PGF-pre-PGF domain-containing protein [Candidatus Methanoperedens sp.]|nr:PGF-pre-PGF domain-containing protein [Candidatus Methanoperedens sp.]